MWHILLQIWVFGYDFNYGHFLTCFVICMLLNLYVVHLTFDFYTSFRLLLRFFICFVSFLSFLIFKSLLLLLISGLTSQICLSFYEVKKSKQSWFPNKIERLYWEQWYVNLNVSQLPRAHSSKSQHSKVIVDPGGIYHIFTYNVKNF